MNKKPEILIIDDDQAIIDSLSSLFRDQGYLSTGALNGHQAHELAKNDSFDLIILDLGLPDSDGLEILKRFKAENIRAPIIIVTGQATISRAIEATRLGAFNMIEKPPDPEKLLLDCQIALKQRLLEDEVHELRKSLILHNDLVGESEAIQSLREKLKRVAASESRVYIWGEPGVGKEMAARFLHFSSPRAARAFVTVNCAAVPGELFESEFFGHEKGAFTGAAMARRGKFEMADGGTLFLDEVAELKPDHQAKLLRIVESMVVQRLGSSKEVVVDVRVLSASNKDIKHETQEGRFREDLYFRLNVIPIHVPPLREHKEDIPLLARHFLDSLGYGHLRLEPGATTILSMYDWPGNVRELKNIIERTAALSYREVITESDIREALSGVLIGGSADALPKATEPLTLRQQTNRYEKLFLEQVLNENDGNITKAARILKMDRGNLSKKLKKYGLTGKE